MMGWYDFYLHELSCFVAYLAIAIHLEPAITTCVHLRNCNLIELHVFFHINAWTLVIFAFEISHCHIWCNAIQIHSNSLITITTITSTSLANHMVIALLCCTLEFFQRKQSGLLDFAGQIQAVLARDL